MTGKSESHGELAKSEISVMPFEQTTLVSGSQMRSMATMLDMEREINSQREQLIRVTYTLDRQVARLSREMELLQERQAANPEANWRVREDIEALSRRMDALEAFCRSEAEAKAEAKAEEGAASLQAQILAVREEVRALHAECHLEQTRDVAGVRARAAVEQMAAKQRAEMEKLHCQMADLQRSMSSQDNTPSSSQGDSSQSLQHLLVSVEPILRNALEQQLGRIVTDLRGDTAARCAELRAEMLGRLDGADGGPQGSGILRRRSAQRSQTLASVSEHPREGPGTQSPSPARPRHLPQESSPMSSDTSRTKEAAVHELDAAVDRLVGKVNLALEGSIGHAAAGSLQESTEALKKCLKDLSHDGKTLQRCMSAIDRSSGGQTANTHVPHPHAVRMASPNPRYRSVSPSQAQQPRYPHSQFRAGYAASMTAPPAQAPGQYPRSCPTQPLPLGRRP